VAAPQRGEDSEVFAERRGQRACRRARRSAVVRLLVDRATGAIWDVGETWRQEIDEIVAGGKKSATSPRSSVTSRCRRIPEMDGYEVARLGRMDPRAKDIPIIFVTATSETEENVFRGYDSGAVDVFYKPVNRHVLRSKVKSSSSSNGAGGSSPRRSKRTGVRSPS
jgi:DNA-binding NarL/FixJ family response regulator